jgi:hypothetical protein
MDPTVIYEPGYEDLEIWLEIRAKEPACLLKLA